jgi:hypothetical protein
MIFANLDSLAKRRLLSQGLPLHYYLEYLLHAATCLRELSFDTLQIINTARLPVNSYGAVEMPHDFVDDVMVGIPVGGMLQPVAKRDNINPLRTFGADGQFENWTSSNSQETNAIFSGTWTWFWNVNDFGEPTGRMFGAGSGSNNGYMVDRKRRQIQVTGNFTSDEIVLMYISDGQSADNATQIDVRAQAAIDAFVGWKTSQNADIKDSYEAATFYNEKRMLRSRLNDLTPDDIKTIIRRNYKATAKT